MKSFGARVTDLHAWEVTARLLEFSHPERVAFRKYLVETGSYPSVEALALLRGDVE
jgi:hypothetical protein